MSPHKSNCVDKVELGIDDDGNDFCMCCGEIITNKDDQLLIQEKFLSR